MREVKKGHFSRTSKKCLIIVKKNYYNTFSDVQLIKPIFSKPMFGTMKLFTYKGLIQMHLKTKNHASHQQSDEREINIIQRKSMRYS